jgi:hypothetical protein
MPTGLAPPVPGSWMQPERGDYWRNAPLGEVAQ